MKLSKILSKLMKLETISSGRLHEMINNKQARVLDVNARQSWLKAHVPGAVNLDPLTYTEADLPEDRESMLVFYCSNPLCTKAPKAARRAEKMGYIRVKVMPAGISGWLAAGLPTEGGQ